MPVSSRRRTVAIEASIWGRRLFKATCASSATQNAIGVMGGMIAATMLDIFFVLLLFVVIAKRRDD
jgi:hypothetical protein